MNTSPSKLLTPNQAADTLAIGRTRLYQLLAEGHLASIRIGRSRRIPQSSVDDYIARLLAEASEDEPR